LEKIEDKIIKAIEKKNIHNKNYFWIVSIFVFTIIIIIYSYHTDTGIIAKQTINKSLMVKNQENLKQLYKNNTPLSNEQPLIEEQVIVSKEEVNTQELPQEKIALLTIEAKDVPLQEEVLLEKDEFKNANTVQDTQPQAPITKEVLVVTSAEIKPIEKIKAPEVKEIVEEKPQEKVTAKEEIASVLKSNETSLAKLIEPKTQFNLTYCYDFEPAKYAFAPSCQERLNNFIQNNATAIRYEIIGLIDVEDVKNLINKGEINQGALAKNRIISVQEYLKTKTQVPLSDHFYYLKSELPMRGFVLRAYF
jgi:hypothetical protein